MVEAARANWLEATELPLARCLKCAAATTRRSSRSNALTLCEECDARWKRAAAVGYAGFAMPAMLPLGAMLIGLSSSLISLAFFLGLIAMFVMRMYAVASSIRVRDGRVDVDTIHPGLRPHSPGANENG